MRSVNHLYIARVPAPLCVSFRPQRRVSSRKKQKPSIEQQRQYMRWEEQPASKGSLGTEPQHQPRGTRWLPAKPTRLGAPRPEHFDLVSPTFQPLNMQLRMPASTHSLSSASTVSSATGPQQTGGAGWVTTRYNHRAGPCNRSPFFPTTLPPRHIQNHPVDRGYVAH